MDHRSVAIAALLVFLPAGSQAQSSYQVVRPGDGQMSCEALAAGINALYGEIADEAQGAQRRAEGRQAAGRVGRGLLSGLARGATILGYNNGLGDGAGGALASSAIAGVADEIANAPTPEPGPAPEVEGSRETPRQQRLAHLRSLFDSRSC